MRWWCSQLYEEWTWTPRPYLGVWTIIVGLWLARHLSLRRWKTRLGTTGVTTRQRWWFWLGVVAFWLSSDWPVGALGAGYLLMVHMAQYLLYTFAAAPLLLLSMPEWKLRALVQRFHLHGTLKVLTRPLPAVLLANGVLIGTHMPWTVDTVRVSQIGSFLLDIVWLVAGFLLWLPVISPIEEFRVRSVPLRLVYLFGAAGLTPMIPGGIFTFARYPLFRTYEIAPRVGVSALSDQQIAGAMMSAFGMPVIWIVAGVVWYRWAREEERNSPPIVRRRVVS